ncbi:MAG: polyhydroxyalkanoate synthesis regulator [Syntrophomonadaceae bacterium]|nr:polyhydroxyalkanoate synthesis regulator [Syntrophomonadaceae bacterium]
MDMFEKFINLGVGAFSITKEKAEKIIDEMVERGEINREEAKKTLEDVIKKGEEQRDQFRTYIREEVDKCKGEHVSSYKSKIEDLEARIKELEDKLNQQTEN